MQLTIALLSLLLAAAPAAASPRAAPPAAGDEDTGAKPPPAPPPVPATIDVAKLRAEYDRLRDALFRARARAELVEEGVYASKVGARIRWKGAPDFVLRRAEVGWTATRSGIPARSRWSTSRSRCPSARSSPACTA